MIICVCHRVSDRDIARVARDGCASFDELQFELSVATACGACHDCARETFHAHAAQAAALRSDCPGAALCAGAAPRPSARIAVHAQLQQARAPTHSAGA